MLRHLRALAVAVCVGLTFAACGSSGSAVPASEPADTITVQTNTGELSVPVNPQRVVALDNTSFETLLEFGVTPVAVPKQLLPDSLAAWAADPEIIDVGPPPGRIAGQSEAEFRAASLKWQREVAMLNWNKVVEASLRALAPAGYEIAAATPIGTASTITISIM